MRVGTPLTESSARRTSLGSSRRTSCPWSLSSPSR
uniref:Uncharacterized protein n=1 Tax=Anguilla anguilla TaxID=7936 RepID=A0A0E9QAT9_ANGAN